MAHRCFYSPYAFSADSARVSTEHTSARTKWLFNQTEIHYLHYDWSNYYIMHISSLVNLL